MERYESKQWYLGVNKNKYKIVFEAMIKSSSIEEPTSPLRLGRHILHELGEFWYRGALFLFCGDVAIMSQETNKRVRHAARAATNARRQAMQEEVVVLRCG
jgi:hypothetical protein